MQESFVIEVSARHAHLNKEAVDVLFGKNHALTPKKQLSQPGQYVCEEKVDIIGPKSKIQNVSIIGSFCNGCAKIGRSGSFERIWRFKIKRRLQIGWA